MEPSERDIAGPAAPKGFQRDEGGCSAIRTARPQTIGYGLTDSPAGQLARRAEKYWAWSDRDGEPGKAIPRDRLLDAVSVGWFAATAASSARLYRESRNRMAPAPVHVPTDVSIFPKDGRTPRPWIGSRFTDLRSWKDHEYGGHFPTLEQPEVLASEPRASFRPLR